MTMEATAELGDQLRAWRSARGKSQLDLALDTGMSQRQISFIETGRSTPGRGNLMHLAQALNVPFRDRNSLLLAAGYAPQYPEQDLNAEEMRLVRTALERMLRQQLPYPGFVMDRFWNVIMANEAATRLFGFFVDLSKYPKPRNLLRLLFDPEGLRPFVANWDETVASVLARVHRESVGRIVDPETRALLDGVLGPIRLQSLATTTNPVVPVKFAKSGVTMSFFSLVTTVGSPGNVGSQELRLECMFPDGPETERNYSNLGNSDPVEAVNR